MTRPSPRASSPPVFLSVLALVLCAGTAEASEVICEGTMRLADCSPAGQVAWPVSSQPTFSAKCKACPSPNPSLNDGGTPPCGPWQAADPRQFTIFGPNTTPGSHALDFEDAGACGDEALFRYVGPLVAGNYDIWLNANPHSYALRFAVAGPVPAPDAGVASGADASIASGTDASMASGTDAGVAPDLETEASSCACVVARRDASALTLVLLGFVGVGLSRRASLRRRRR